MSDEKNCKATLYVCTPLEMLKPGYNPFKRSGITAHTGHAFVGLTDEAGKEMLWSFSFSEAKNPLQKITGCPGKLSQTFPKFAEYNEAIVYPITREQFDAANKKVDELKNKITSAIGLSALQEDDILITSAAHYKALKEASAELRFAKERFEELELMAEHIRRALLSLRRLIGEVTPDDVLGEIFSKFCVGK